MRGIPGAEGRKPYVLGRLYIVFRQRMPIVEIG
jgi:hypothetical protein